MTNGEWNINDKTVVITGATNGIGKATAAALAALGAHVVLICRDKSKAENVIAEIRNTTPNAKLDVIIADLASQSAVRNAANEILTRFDRLHVLINNAGVILGKRRITDDGIEMQFAVNHLAPFLLTNLLLPCIVESAPARIVNVSSDMHQSARLNFDDLQSERSYSGMGTYGKTKLANVLFTYELARRLKDYGVTANCIHPGVVSTGILTNLAFPLNVLVKPATYFMLTPAKGAETSVYLASTPEVSGLTGKYFVKKRETPSSTASHNVEDARRLWDISAKMTGLDAS